MTWYLILVFTAVGAQGGVASEKLKVGTEAQCLKSKEQAIVQKSDWQPLRAFCIEATEIQ